MNLKLMYGVLAELQLLYKGHFGPSILASGETQVKIKMQKGVQKSVPC